MDTPYFYFYSYEIYTRSGNLKQKGHGTVSRTQKIADPDDFESFETFVRTHRKIAKTDQLYWVSITQLNA